MYWYFDMSNLRYKYFCIFIFEKILKAIFTRNKSLWLKENSIAQSYAPRDVLSDANNIKWK